MARVERGAFQTSGGLERAGTDCIPTTEIRDRDWTREKPQE